MNSCSVWDCTKQRESMLLEDFVMPIPAFKGNNIITKLKNVNVTEMWSLVMIQEH